MTTANLDLSETRAAHRAGDAAGPGFWRHDVASDTVVLEPDTIGLLAQGDVRADLTWNSFCTRIAPAPLTEQADQSLQAVLCALFPGVAPDGQQEAVRKIQRQDGSPLWVRIHRLEATEQAVSGVIEDLSSAAETLATKCRRLDLLEQRWSYINASTGLADIGLWNIRPATGECWFSPSWFTALGYDPDAFAHSFDSFAALVHPQDLPEVVAAYDAAIDGRTPEYRVDVRLRHRDGRYLDFESRAQLVPVDGSASETMLCGAQMNIVGRIEARQRIEACAAETETTMKRLRTLTENVPGAIYELRMERDGSLSFPFATSGLGTLVGLSDDTVRKDAQALFQLVHPDDVEAVQTSVAQSARDLTPWHTRHRIVHPEKGIVWIQATSQPRREASGAVVWAGCAFDVTKEMDRAQELERIRAEREHQALHDALTGLPNRRHFDMQLSERQQDRRAIDQRHTLIRIDLDYFKMVNDTLGHAAGDATLKRVADILNATLRKDDFAARIGGDEFVVLLAPGQTAENALALVDRVQQEIGAPFYFEGKPCRFGSSFGVASQIGFEGGAGLLLSNADAALYEAKASGRGRVNLFTPELQTMLERLRKRADEVQEAIETERFEPYFHPQVDVASGGLAGFEVLARWVTPSGAVIAPNDFMAVAEHIRVVGEIDRQVFEKAIDINARLCGQGQKIPKLSFNVSAARILDPEIILSAKALQVCDCRIGFELLESILLEDDSLLLDHHIDLLRESGVEIEVDDFGSGHASVIGVMKVRPDALKIDGRIIMPLLDEKHSRALVHALIEIGQALDIAVTAEGVSTLEHARILAGMGCSTLQGFAFARPLDATGLVEYLRAFKPYDFRVEGPEKRAG